MTAGQRQQLTEALDALEELQAIWSKALKESEIDVVEATERREAYRVKLTHVDTAAKALRDALTLDLNIDWKNEPEES